MTIDFHSNRSVELVHNIFPPDLQILCVPRDLASLDKSVGPAKSLLSYSDKFSVIVHKCGDAAGAAHQGG